MQIIYAEIRNLVTFKLAQIKSLVITFTENLQVILGTNGSGKSNLLRQLNPLPAVRSDYMEGGYRRLVIKHKDSVYELISDFSNKDKAHSFIKDGISLNESGATNLQTELVEEYLGWTADVQKISSGQYDICKMTQNPRKVLLLTVSQLGFILEASKKTTSRIRACKNNLSMLHNRKSILETKMLDETVVQSLEKEKVKLLKDVLDYTDLIGRIKSFLSSNSPDTRVDWATTKSDLTQSISTLKRKLAYWQKFDRTKSHSEQLEEISSRTNFLLGTKDALTAQLEELTASLTQKEFTLSEMTEAEIVTELKLRVESLKSQLIKLKDIMTDNPLPRNIIPRKETVLGELNNILSKFLDCPIKLIPRRLTQLKRHKVDMAIRKVEGIEYELVQLNTTLQQFEDSITLREQDLPQSNCSKMSCVLYRSFKLTYDSTVSRITSTKLRIHKFERLRDRYRNYITKQSEALKTLSIYTEALDELFVFIGNHGYLQSLFQSPNTLSILTVDPMSFWGRANALFAQSEATYEAEKVRDTLLKEELELSKASDLSEGEKERLLTTIASIKKRQGEISAQLLSIDTRIAALVHEEALIKSHQSTLVNLEHLTQKLKDEEKNYARQAENDFLREVQRDITQINNTSFQRIGEIDQTITEQKSLRARYDEEVLSQIVRLENEKKEWEDLEFALIRIPQYHTAAYLNALIRLTNTFIAKVFTYDFELCEIDPEKPIDFRFAYRARLPEMEDEIHVADISHCSGAQTEIVNFAFNQAMRITKGILGYPLFTDELGSTFDVIHQQRVFDLLKFLLDEEFVSQIFLVNHHALVHEGLSNREVLVLNETNIVLPEGYNSHVDMR